MPVRRPRNLKLMVSDDEYAQLQYVMNKTGLSGADVIRQLIRAAHRRLQPNSQTAATQAWAEEAATIFTKTPTGRA